MDFTLLYTKDLQGQNKEDEMPGLSAKGAVSTLHHFNEHREPATQSPCPVMPIRWCTLKRFCSYIHPVQSVRGFWSHKVQLFIVILLLPFFPQSQDLIIAKVISAFLFHSFFGIHITAYFNAQIFGIQGWLVQLQTDWQNFTFHTLRNTILSRFTNVVSCWLSYKDQIYYWGDEDETGKGMFTLKSIPFPSSSPFQNYISIVMK